MEVGGCYRHLEQSQESNNGSRLTYPGGTEGKLRVGADCVDRPEATSRMLLRDAQVISRSTPPFDKFVNEVRYASRN